MIYAILSDIHGNLPALEKVINKTNYVDRYIILGDVVNYGPWSNECVDLIESLDNTIKIQGNHEIYFLEKTINTNNSLLKNFFSYSFYNFKRFKELEKYKKKYLEKNILYTHTIDNKYIYSDTKLNTTTNLFIGHSHKQFINKNKKKNFVANPGSVGQNREHINKIDYIIFNTSNYRIELKFLLYDIGILINEMKVKNFPTQCINYYLNKKKYD